MSFEGKTGPYVQYNGARIQSILSKGNVDVESLKSIDVETKEEKSVLMALFKLIDSYDICVNDFSLNALCTALFDLASSFAQFYNNINILKEVKDERRKSLLCLSYLTLKALKQGLNVLAIEMPEKM